LFLSEVLEMVNREEIARKNDFIRRTFTGGMILLTSGVEALESADKEATEAAARAMFDAGLEAGSIRISEKLLRFYWEHGIESDDAFQRFLEKEFGEADPKILAAGLNAYLKEKYLRLKPYPKVKETLEELKKRGLKLGVVSDGVRLKAWMRLNAAGLDKYFDAVVTHEDTGKEKPAKEPFLKACKELEVKPEECLMVGDWVERDIEGAKALGMKTCLAKYGQVVGRKKGADYEIDDVRRLLDVVE